MSRSTLTGREVWLDLYWLQPSGPNIREHPERIEEIHDSSRGHVCPDLTAALSEVMRWVRRWSYLDGWLFMCAEIRDGQPRSPLIGRITCEDDVYSLLRATGGING